MSTIVRYANHFRDFSPINADLAKQKGGLFDGCIIALTAVGATGIYASYDTRQGGKQGLGWLSAATTTTPGTNEQFMLVADGDKYRFLPLSRSPSIMLWLNIDAKGNEPLVSGVPAPGSDAYNSDMQTVWVSYCSGSRNPVTLDAVQRCANNSLPLYLRVGKVTGSLFTININGTTSIPIGSTGNAIVPTCTITTLVNDGTYNVGLASNNTISNTPTTWAIEFMKIPHDNSAGGTLIWDALLKIPTNAMICCGYVGTGVKGAVAVGDWTLDPGFEQGCTAAGLKNGPGNDTRATCNKIVGTVCGSLPTGFVSDKPTDPQSQSCYNWCLLNPTGCYESLSAWCGKNTSQGKPECACFDSQSYGVFATQLGRQCSTKGDCQAKPDISGPHCFYPRCFSGVYGPVFEANNLKCGNTEATNAYVKCVKKSFTKDGGVGATVDEISNKCVTPKPGAIKPVDPIVITDILTNPDTQITTTIGGRPSTTTTTGTGITISGTGTPRPYPTTITDTTPEPTKGGSNLMMWAIIGGVGGFVVLVIIIIIIANSSKSR